MAVYKRNYKTYNGPLTSERWRFLAIPRYAFKDLFASKFLTAFFVACYVPVLAEALLIYFRYNASAIEKLGLPLDQIIAVDNSFFLAFHGAQGVLAFLLTVLVGPGLVSPDLVNNALPLYFCRPFNRAEYVLGKMSVLVILLSLITWVPGLLMFLLQASLADSGWVANYYYLPAAIFFGSLIWILVLSLLSLAISAWVRWRPLAGAVMFLILFVAAAFGNMIYGVLDLRWGKWMDLLDLIRVVSTWLFRVDDWSVVSVGEAWAVLLGICGLCLLILARKIQAYEVVR